MTRKHASKATRTKPSKPSKNFPLYAHPNGQWAKKVRGKTYFFGVWEDPNAALLSWVNRKDHLLAGIEELVTTHGDDALTVKDLCNLAYHDRVSRFKHGKLAKRSLDEFKQAADRTIEFFGAQRPIDSLRPVHFAKFRASLSKGISETTLNGRIGYIRAIFNWGCDNNIVPTRKEELWGKSFNKPSRKELRKERGSKERWIEPVQLRALIDNANPQMKAMLYLSINAAFGNTDCATVTFDAIDLDGGWIRWARPKTGVDRRCPLWPETVQAIRAWIECRPKNLKRNQNLLFVTRYGNRWDSTSQNNPISKEFAKLRDAVGITTPGVCFYAARHVFQTIAELEDKLAATVIMGHVDESIQSAYRVLRMFPDEKLIAVTDRVHHWLAG